MKELTDAQLGALFANLSRGCEKQYRPEEAALLQTLSGWFQSRAGALPGTLAELSGMLREDLAAYAPAFETAAAHADRGALRALTWSEKVTKILHSLLARFEKNPAVAEGQNVYVCEICGFAYVGAEKMDICPVCKVPHIRHAAVARR